MQARERWLLLVWLCLLAACGTPANQSPTSSDQGSTQQRAANSIIVSGSSTVYPLTYRLAYAAQSSGMALDVKIANVGTGGGFRAFCADERVDIVNASRAINATEQAACTNIGRSPVPFQIGYDALTISVSKQNTFVTDLSVEQLERIFTSSVSMWNEVDSRYPAKPIALYSPGKDSGTFDYFAQVVLTGDGSRLAKSAITSEDDNDLVTGLEANPDAIGYFGYAYYQFNDDNLRAIPIRRSAQDAPIAPPDTTVENSTYPFIRPLFLYSDTATIRDKPYVAEFLDFYLERVNTLIRDIGYFPEQKETLLQARQTLASIRD